MRAAGRQKINIRTGVQFGVVFQFFLKLLDRVPSPEPGAPPLPLSRRKPVSLNLLVHPHRLSSSHPCITIAPGNRFCPWRLYHRAPSAPSPALFARESHPVTRLRQVLVPSSSIQSKSTQVRSVLSLRSSYSTLFYPLSRLTRSADRRPRCPWRLRCRGRRGPTCRCPSCFYVLPVASARPSCY